LGIFSGVSLFKGVKLSQTLFKGVIYVNARCDVVDLTTSQKTIDICHMFLESFWHPRPPHPFVAIKKFQLP
jgi:hypothetical protein